MFGKVLALFKSVKLANNAWFFGCVVLGIAAITGMAWAYCGAQPGKQRCRTSEESVDQ